jgi:hypothetical protein
MPSVCVTLTKEELNHQHEQLLLTSLDSQYGRILGIEVSSQGKLLGNVVKKWARHLLESTGIGKHIIVAALVWCALKTSWTAFEQNMMRHCFI